MVYFQEIGRGYTFSVEIATTAGATNLWMWQGEMTNPSVILWTELR